MIRNRNDEPSACIASMRNYQSHSFLHSIVVSFLGFNAIFVFFSFSAKQNFIHFRIILHYFMNAAYIYSEWKCTQLNGLNSHCFFLTRTRTPSHFIIPYHALLYVLCMCLLNSAIWQESKSFTKEPIGFLPVRLSNSTSTSRSRFPFLLTLCVSNINSYAFANRTDDARAKMKIYFSHSGSISIIVS